jgi:hypothetical protein
MKSRCAVTLVELLVSSELTGSRFTLGPSVDCVADSHFLPLRRSLP